MVIVLPSSNCSGVMVAPNMVLTSAACVAFNPFSTIKVYTDLPSDRNPFNVTHVHMHDRLNLINLTNDVALVQLNGTSNVQRPTVDWLQTKTNDCLANFRYGKVNGNTIMLYTKIMCFKIFYLYLFFLLLISRVRCVLFGNIK